MLIEKQYQSGFFIGEVGLGGRLDTIEFVRAESEDQALKMYVLGRNKRTYLRVDEGATLHVYSASDPRPYEVRKLDDEVAA